MLKILLFVLSIIFINSCSTTYGPPVPEEYYKLGLIDFAFDIIRNPEKLRDLKLNYPQFYDKDYLYVTLSDSIYLSQIINEIKLEFKDPNQEIILSKSHTVSADIEGMNIVPRTNFHFKSEMLFSFHIITPENNTLLTFIFVKINTSQFRIFRIQQYFIKNRNPN